MARHSGKSKAGRGGSRGGLSRGRGRGGSLRGRGSSRFSRRTISSSRAFEEISNNAVKDDLEELHQNMHSMSFNSRRPGRSSNPKVASDSRRHQPVEFVKASNVYDPSAEYFKLFKKKDEGENEQKLLELINESFSARERPSISISSSDDDSDVPDKPNSGELSNSSQLEISRVIVSEQVTKTSGNAFVFKDTRSDEEAEDGRGLASIMQSGSISHDEQLDDIDAGSDSDKCSVHERSLNGKEGLSEEDNAYIEEDDSQIEEEEPAREEEYLVELTIDGDGDSRMAKKFHEPKPRISDLIAYDNFDSADKPGFTRQDAHNDDSDEDKNTLSVGKVLLKVSKEKDGDMFVTLPGQNNRSKKQSSLDDVVIKDFVDDYDSDDAEERLPFMEDDSEFDDDDDSDDDPWNDGYVSSTNFDIMAELSDDSKSDGNDSESDDGEEDDPPYGFCEEDYDFDCSCIAVKNIRFGITNSLYVRCAELTGMEDEYSWIEQGDVLAYAWAKGVPEHRLDAFLTHITNGEINPSPPEEPDYDVYISDSSDDEAADLAQNYTQQRSEFTDEMEDVDVSILELIESQKRLKAGTDRAMDALPTRSLETRGKGKKKKLILEGLSCDDAIKEALLNQHAIRTNGHRAKKLARIERERERAIAHHDLHVKYPYSMHIGEMILEARALYEDRTRVSVSYPPLDYHGFDTLKKIATSLGMSLKMAGGNGKHQYAKMVKRKNSHKYMNENLLAELKRGRPVFHRTDQKRPKEEIIAQFSASGKNKASGRNGVKTTVYQEGEIVGATAPQIADSNFGRQMLLKLGWTDGEGLGALGNKGISEPVMAKIKKTKEGLKKTS